MADVVAPSPSQALCSEQAEKGAAESRSEPHFQRRQLWRTLTMNPPEAKASAEKEACGGEAGRPFRDP